MPRLIGIQLIGFTVLLQSLRSTTGDCVEATNVTCLAACRCEFCIISRESWGNLKLTCKAESGIELEKVIKQVPSETVLLHLERNKLSKIDGGTFRHLKKLERLYIANNKLDGMHIDDLAFDGLENLQHLDLSSNSRPGITVGNSEWFKPLKQLRIYQCES
uniref:Leucine-rich repeat transmembrane neuronal protein 2-like n=1 Tax=Saccoglossus kowalevskii TaxID=10224 RepID=A0ABM0MZ94_SACKO|nr:PREDICTED: leucine-rich repeat transmembrane neuronal protein 2-like [Saccoglossus kowalevskii]